MQGFHRDPHLQMRRGKWDSSLVLARHSVFLSRGDGYVRELLELHQGCQGPFRGSRGKVGFLLRHRRGKRPHLALRGESPAFSVCSRENGVPLKLRRGPQGPARVASGKSSLHASCKRPLRMLSSRCRVLRPYLELRLNLRVPFQG